MSKRQTAILLILMFYIGFIYFFSASYINYPNAGNHFALVSTLFENKSPNIQGFIHYTQKIDYAIKNGNYYSGRIPGNAFIATPFYLYAIVLREFQVNQTITNYSLVEDITIIFQPVMFGILGILVLLIYSLQKIIKTMQVHSCIY